MATVCTTSPAIAQQSASRALPPSTLAVRTQAGPWKPFWNSAHAPTAWHDAPLSSHVSWRPAARGVEWGIADLAGHGEAWRTRLVVVRIDPAAVWFRLDTAFHAKGEPAWSIDRAPDQAVAAVNAGQFTATLPWGWVVLNGHQWLSPQPGPLSAALVVDTAGLVRWVPHAALDTLTRMPASRSRAAIRWAFQSYPVLLDHDTIPLAVRRAGAGIDVAHRDARAAIGLDRQGRVLIALTRFDALGPAFGAVPFGITTPEMAAIMGALGCHAAMLLDGGISAQLRVRDSTDVIHDWIGWRRVPLALVAIPR